MVKMQVRRIDEDAFMVSVDADTRDVLHVNRYTPRRVQELPAVHMSRRPAPEQPGAFATDMGLLPVHYTMNNVTMMPDFHGSGLEQPWKEPRGSGLLLPKEVADDLSFQRTLPVKLLIDPESLGVSPIGEVLRTAARHLLARTKPEELMRIGLHWAFACEVAHRPWAQAKVVRDYHNLTAPKADRQWLRNRAERLLVPQMARVIAIDAACTRGQAEPNDLNDPSLLSPTVRSLIAEYLPSVVNGQAPSPPEIRTAIWLLSIESPFEITADGGPSMLMAYAFGARSVGEAHLSPMDWANLVSLPDDHCYGSWGPGQAPSDLRAELWTASGLDLRVVAMVGTWMLETMVKSQHSDNQMWTQPALADRFQEDRGRSIEPVLDFIARHLVISADAMRKALLVEDANYEAPSDAAECRRLAVERRKQIEQLCSQHPFVQFDDGTIIPVGLGDVSYRTIELCQEPHNGQTEKPHKRRQRIGGLLGHCFEARVKELSHSIKNGHFVIDSDTLNKVIDCEAGKDAKRGDDVVIWDLDGNYLVVEATKKNLRLGIRYADDDALEEWVDEHRRKHQQAINTARHLPAITTEGGFPPPKTVTTLVVGDLVLPQNVALSVLFNRGTDEPQPPFLCSLTEFKQLVDLGQQKFSVPLIVRAWQNAGTDESLTVFLSEYPLR